MKKKTNPGKYYLLICKTAAVILMLMSISCSEAPPWRKRVNLETLDSLTRIAQLHNVNSFHSKFDRKIQFNANGFPEESASAWAISFVELCEKNEVIAVSFGDNYKESFWSLHLNKELQCHEGLIISSLEDIETYYQNLPQPLTLKQIKPDYFWYSGFTRRGNFREDLLEVSTDNVFPNY